MAPRVPIYLKLELTDKQLDEVIGDIKKDGVICKEQFDLYARKPDNIITIKCPTCSNALPAKKSVPSPEGNMYPDHNYTTGPHPSIGGYFGTEPPSGSIVSRLTDDDDDDDEIPFLKCRCRSPRREKETSEDNSQLSKIEFSESGDDSLKFKFNLIEYLENYNIPLTLVPPEKKGTELITNFKTVKPSADLSFPNKKWSFKSLFPIPADIKCLVDLVLEDEKVHGIYESEPICPMNYSEDQEASSSSIDVETIDCVPSTSKARPSRTKRKKHTFDNTTKRRKTVKRGNSPKQPVKRGRKPKSNGAKENVKVKRVYEKRNQSKKCAVLQPSPGNDPNSLCNSRAVAKLTRMHVNYDSDDEEVVSSKRMKPVVAERMRRQKLKELLENLRCAVPAVCRNAKASQVAILQAAAPEVCRLREEQKKLQKEIKELEKERAEKEKRIEKLLMHSKR